MPDSLTIPSTECQVFVPWPRDDAAGARVPTSRTVSESVSMLETETASRSQIISNELIANVPTQGRNPFQIAWAAPGVIKSGSWRSTSSGKVDRGAM
jgi:hypothetical protein